MDFSRLVQLMEKIGRPELFLKYCTESAMGTVSQAFLIYLGPSFSNILGPCSCHSCLVIHMFSLSAICGMSAAEKDCVVGSRDRLTMFASTAPPRKTICLRRGGSSILTLNFYRQESVL